MPTPAKSRIFALCVLIAFTTEGLPAQDAARVLVADVVQHWQTLKSLALDVARAIPQNEYAVKPAPTESEARKIGSGMNEIVLPSVLSCSIALGKPAPARFQSAFDRPMDSTKPGVIMNLSLAYDFCIDALNQTNDPDLFRMSPRGFKGHAATRFDILWDAYARAALTIGVVEASMRSKGITPPNVGPRFDF